MNDILAPFAQMIAGMVAIYNQQQLLDGNRHKPFVLRELKHSIKWVIKHSGPLVPPNSSVLAHQLALAKNIDIFALKWKDQLKAESIIAGAGKRIIRRNQGKLFHEHKTPVESTLKDILSSGGDYEKILTSLCNQEIVWILREENERLEHRNRDNDNHNEEYSNVGIEIITNQYGIDWINRNAFNQH
jgi:hypothetical protein